MRLKLRQIELNEFVVLSTFVFSEFLGIHPGEFSYLRSLGSCKVVVHAVIEAKKRCGGTNFSTHVTWRKGS